MIRKTFCLDPVVWYQLSMGQQGQEALNKLIQWKQRKYSAFDISLWKNRSLIIYWNQITLSTHYMLKMG